jgi:pSer/pThr/pTyr-binding forkhead associated (FHA) protein
MKFCRSCGSALAGGVPSAAPVPATLMSDSPAALQQIIAQSRGQAAPGGMPPAGPIGGGGPPRGGPQPGAFPQPAPPGSFPQPGAFPPPGGAGAFPAPQPQNAFPQPGAFPAPPTTPPTVPSAPGPGPKAAAPAGTITCPRCGTATPTGFAYCQQCGLHMQALSPTDPSPPRARTPSASPPMAPTIAAAVAPVVRAPSAQQPAAPAMARPSGAQQQPPIDAQAATLATDGIRAGSISNPAKPAAATGPAWGTAVLVNRDGSDGQRFPLAGEYLVIGRTGTDIEFADDRFLARQHARLERAQDGSVKVVPMDLLNGVFRKADAPIDLSDGTTILVGREVLRFERLEAEEVKVHPLVRHGVALFGSPPREPWGRLVALVPSGGYRDVRHLTEKEVVLGREEGDIVFRDDAFMSRRHAAVTWDGKKAQVTDLGSSNGTFVRLAGPTPLKHGDHVRMGDQLLRIELGR